MNRDLILSFAPWIEVVVKNFYWRSKIVNKLLASRTKRRITVEPQAPSEPLEFERILDALDGLGVRRGGIMVVHSSMSSLQSTKLTAKEVCAQLLGFLGSTGTLAMPAIPLYRDEPTGPERLTDSICAKSLTYDVRRTPPWTGALPKALMGYPGAIRSRHPLNSMVAVGPDAAAMMEKNIEGARPLACGSGSSWKYCADRDAAIVCIGVDSAHSLTMIHVAEDCWCDEWPVADWYRERKFHVKDGNFESDLTVLERRPRWAINYAERTLQKDLLRMKIIRVETVAGVRIEVCSSARLVEYLKSRRASAYPYWIPFWHRNAQ